MRSLALLLVLAVAPCGAQQAPAESTRVYELSQVEQQPHLVNQQAYGRELARSYPVVLRDSGVGGTVEVRFQVNPDGRTSNQTVTRSTDARFDEPTLRAVRMMRFRPARVGGRPARVWVTQPIQWTIVTPGMTMEPLGAHGGGSLNPGSVICEDVRCVNGAVDELPRPRDIGALARSMAREYPAVLRNAETAAESVVRFRIEMDGTVTSPRVMGASHPELVEPSLRAVRALRYTPAQVNGRPVAVWMQQPLHWPAPSPAP